MPAQHSVKKPTKGVAEPAVTVWHDFDPEPFQKTAVGPGFGVKKVSTFYHLNRCNARFLRSGGRIF